MPRKRTSPRPRVERICQHCGVVFSTIPAKVDYGEALYCSRPCAFAAKRIPVEDRFWQKVDKSGDCWLWTASRNVHGYGTILVDRKSILAHRVAWELVNGPIPSDLRVCHTCDNPACVRPDHLFLGTQQDNVQDMVRKGRSTFGTRSHNAKLTDAAVREIRTLFANGVAAKDIADQFSIHPKYVAAVANRRRWKHVE